MIVYRCDRLASLIQRGKESLESAFVMHFWEYSECVM
jgi:hypothetical protein